MFEDAGCWFKGNLHMHTTLSDGRLTPEEATSLYRGAGYDFIALTDHWIQSEGREETDFLVLRGCEWDTGDMVNHPIYHIVGVGMDRHIDLARSQSIPPQEFIDAILAAGGLAILAHPAWSLTNVAESSRLEGLCGVEIYNTFSGPPYNCRADSSLYVDLWASRGRLARCMAADDCHPYDGEQARSFIMVKAPELSAAAIRKALSNGDFYASQGPQFHSISCAGAQVQVECSESQAVVFYTNTVYCPDRATTATASTTDGGTGGVTHASYTIKPTDTFVRVELVDAEGLKAWSSPFWVSPKERLA